MTRLRSRRSFSREKPSIVTSPAVGRRRPVSILMVVLLPAPLGPRNPKNRPRGTSNEMPSTATFLRKAFVRWRTTIAGPGAVLIGESYPETSSRSISATLARDAPGPIAARLRRSRGAFDSRLRAPARRSPRPLRGDRERGLAVPRSHDPARPGRARLGRIAAPRGRGAGGRLPGPPRRTGPPPRARGPGPLPAAPAARAPAD